MSGLWDFRFKVQLNYTRSFRYPDDSISKIIAIMLSRSLHLSLVTLKPLSPQDKRSRCPNFLPSSSKPRPQSTAISSLTLSHSNPTSSTAFHRTEILNSLRARGGHSSVHREGRWDPIWYKIRVTANDSGVGGERLIIVGGGCGGNCRAKVSQSWADLNA